MEGKGNLDNKIKSILYKLVPILFWIGVWHIASRIIHKEMLLASPFDVLVTLLQLSKSVAFWQSILHSFFKIILGFILAICTGILLGVLSYVNRICKELISPIIKLIKATPVASFIILALLWVNSGNLSILISFLMVLPIIYTNILQGLKSTDEKMLEMAKVFQINKKNKMLYIYLPEVMPYFVSACSVGLGFCWKSGIAAEVIGLPKNSIGEQLYEAKLYLMTKELFAWTIVIIIISVIFEKLVMKLMKKLQVRLIHGNIVSES